MVQFTLKLTDAEKIKLNTLSEWFGISKSSILKEGISHRWDKWSKKIEQYPSYIDYLNR